MVQVETWEEREARENREKTRFDKEAGVVTLPMRLIIRKSCEEIISLSEAFMKTFIPDEGTSRNQYLASSAYATLLRKAQHLDSAIVAAFNIKSAGGGSLSELHWAIGRALKNTLQTLAVVAGCLHESQQTAIGKPGIDDEEVVTLTVHLLEHIKDSLTDALKMDQEDFERRTKP